MKFIVRIIEGFQDWPGCPYDVIIKSLRRIIFETSDSRKRGWSSLLLQPQRNINKIASTELLYRVVGATDRLTLAEREIFVEFRHIEKKCSKLGYKNLHNIHTDRQTDRHTRSKCGKPNDELPVEGSRKDTVLQCEFVDECKVMDMKQTSNCLGFNVTFRPSSDVELYLFTGKKVKKI